MPRSASKSALGWPYPAIPSRERRLPGYHGYKRRNGSKGHIAVDSLGHLLALKVTAASEQERAQVAGLAAEDAKAQHIRLEVVKLPKAKKGFVLLPRRWVVERSFGRAARFKRLSRDYERLATTLAGLHWLAFSTLLLSSLFPKS